MTCRQQFVNGENRRSQRKRSGRSARTGPSLYGPCLVWRNAAGLSAPAGAASLALSRRRSAALGIGGGLQENKRSTRAFCSHLTLRPESATLFRSAGRELSGRPWE